MAYGSIFKRYELKYILSIEQYRLIKSEMERYMRGDKYGESDICNLYCDTPNFLLIRRSIEKPFYKEKLRIRSYGVAKKDGDGVDSNSTSSYAGIVFSGGTSVIISTGNSDSSIDTERGYKYSGGLVIGIGRSGGMGSESTNCSNFSSVGTSKTVSLQKDGYLAVEGIATVKMPVSMNALVVCLGKTSASISAGSSTSYSLDANGVYWNK